MVLGGFWEAKILDFRSLFDVFSKSFLKRLSDDENGVPEGGGGRLANEKLSGPDPPTRVYFIYLED